MSPKPRFQALRVVDRGYPIAVVKDTKAGRIHWVRRQGSMLLEWDRLDHPVKNGLLRHAARVALDEHAERLLAAIGAPCRRCGNPFKSNRKNARTCNPCVSAIGRENGLKAHVEEAA